MAALLGRKALEGLARGDGELGHRAGCSHTVIQNCPLAACVEGVSGAKLEAALEPGGRSWRLGRRCIEGTGAVPDG